MTTTATYSKPLPDINDPLFAPFWAAAKEHKLRMQRCPDCGYVRFPPAKRCPECLAENDEWVELSGKGTVWSFGVYHHVFNKHYAGDIPYNVAFVQLAEGPRLFTNIVGIANDDIAVNMPVEAVFDDVTDAVTLVKFRPAGR